MEREGKKEKKIKKKKKTDCQGPEHRGKVAAGGSQAPNHLYSIFFLSCLCPHHRRPAFFSPSFHSASCKAQRVQDHSVRKRIFFFFLSSLGMEPPVNMSWMESRHHLTNNSQEQAGARQEAHSFLVCVALVSKASFLGHHAACAVLCPQHTPTDSKSRHCLIDG